MTKVGTFISTPLTLGGERSWRLNQSPITQSCLCNEETIKTQKAGVRQLLSWWTQWRLWESGVLGEYEEPLSPFPIPCLMHGILAVPELHPFIINWSSSKLHESLKSVSCSNKLIEPKKVIVGTSDLLPVVQKYRWQPGLQLVCEGRGR